MTRRRGDDIDLLELGCGHRRRAAPGKHAVGDLWWCAKCSMTVRVVDVVPSTVGDAS